MSLPSPAEFLPTFLKSSFPPVIYSGPLPLSLGPRCVPSATISSSRPDGSPSSAPIFPTQTSLSIGASVPRLLVLPPPVATGHDRSLKPLLLQ